MSRHAFKALCPRRMTLPPPKQQRRMRDNLTKRVGAARVAIFLSPEELQLLLHQGAMRGGGAGAGGAKARRATSNEVLLGLVSHLAAQSFSCAHTCPTQLVMTANMRGRVRLGARSCLNTQSCSLLSLVSCLLTRLDAVTTHTHASTHT
jgi:hypothetical protein